MINEIRQKIDKVDQKIVELLNKRAGLARRIGEEKERRGLTITDKKREEEVIAGLKEANDGPFTDRQLVRIYREIISETKNLEEEV